MSKFIKLLVLFLMPILIGMVSLEVVLRKIPNDYSYKRKYLDAGAQDIEVLFLGSSHFYYGINPAYMTRKAFNGAHISQSLNVDLAILEKYKDRWKKLKYIIIPVDYFSMYSTLENSIEKWRVKNYSIYYDISINKNYWNKFEVLNGKLGVNFSRVKPYLFNHKTDITCNELGFGTNYNSKQSKDLVTTGQIAAKRHTLDLEQNKVTFENNIQVVKSLIAFAAEKNCKLIFITSPCYSTYTEKLNLVQLDNTVNIVTQLTAKEKNTFYFNLLRDQSFTPEDFFDADHLNEKGAKKLTAKMDSIINSLESIVAKRAMEREKDM